MQQRWVCHAILSLAAVGATYATASAQAWVPDKGTLGVSLNYNYSRSDKVVTDTSFSFPDAGTISHQETLALEYTPIDKLAIGASLPLLSIKYRNPGYFQHQQPPGGPKIATYDDGDYHTTLTDLRFGARYQLLDDPIALTPSIAASIPVADYETIGNAVGGRHLKQLHAGLAAGYIIGTASYVHLQYEFTYSERYDKTSTADMNHDIKGYGQSYSDIVLQVGTKLLDYRLDIHATAQSRIAHGGENFSDIFLTPVKMDGTGPEDYTLTGAPNMNYYHDAILKEDIFLVGGGIAYDINESLSISLDYRHFIEQIKLSQNTQNSDTLAIGLAWTPLHP
ncbi:MAG TPA: hypothetical protein VGM39_07485 [Kofleriaceae bacterium]|jgi:hypothetical protein